MKKLEILYRFRFYIVCILIFSLTYFFAGCYSTQTYTIPAEDIKKHDEYEILTLKLKDSSKIKVNDKEARYFPKYKDTSNIILYKVIDTTFFSGKYSVKIKLMYQQLDNIQSIKIEKQKFSLGKTLLWTGVAAGITLIVLAVLFNIWFKKTIEGSFKPNEFGFGK